VVIVTFRFFNILILSTHWWRNSSIWLASFSLFEGHLSTIGPKAGNPIELYCWMHHFLHISAGVIYYIRPQLLPSIYHSQIIAQRYGFEIRRWSNPYTGLYKPWGFQEIGALRVQDNRRGNVVSHMHRAPLPQEIFLELILVAGWLDLRVIVRPEGLCQWKIPMTPSGIELVAQCFKPLRHLVP